MNILIENNETQEYFTPAGEWTKNPCDGKRYGKTEEAFLAAKQEAIGKFTIVGHFPTTNQFLNLDRGRGKGVVAVGEPVTSPEADA
jgi:hypothetical protein